MYNQLWKSNRRTEAVCQQGWPVPWVQAVCVSAVDPEKLQLLRIVTVPVFCRAVYRAGQHVGVPLQDPSVLPRGSLFSLIGPQLWCPPHMQPHQLLPGAPLLLSPIQVTPCPISLPYVLGRISRPPREYKCMVGLFTGSLPPR